MRGANEGRLTRTALKTAAIVLYNLVFVCLAFTSIEYVARKVAYGQLGSPSGQTELILDRWAAFRNNPNYRHNGVQINAEGFRHDQDVARDKPAHSVRIILLGGSVAYGGETLYPEIDDRWRIDNQQTIDRYLEKRLNSAFPAKHWEVINAAVKGYFLNQDLAILLSTLQRYRPDYLILLDGVNDIFAMLRVPENQDSYSAAGLSEEFDGLTKPGSLSLRLMTSTWLFNNSALYRSIRETTGQRNRIRARRERARETAAHLHPDFDSLTSSEQHQYRAAANRLSSYIRTVRQIHRVAELEKTQAVFVLQPQIAVTRKPLTNTETQLLDYWSRLDGPLFVYGFQTLYPQLSSLLSAGAETDGYRFLNATNAFDGTSVQAFTDYCHLTPAGNQAMAEVIFNSLVSQAGIQ
jgi:lysophospholipase L1-like esterase